MVGENFSDDGKSVDVFVRVLADSQNLVSGM